MLIPQKRRITRVTDLFHLHRPGITPETDRRHTGDKRCFTYLQRRIFFPQRASLNQIKISSGSPNYPYRNGSPKHNLHLHHHSIAVGELHRLPISHPIEPNCQTEDKRNTPSHPTSQNRNQNPIFNKDFGLIYLKKVISLYTKQNVMDDDRAFRWHCVDHGDTIDIFNGSVSGGSL